MPAQAADAGNAGHQRGPSTLPFLETSFLTTSSEIAKVSALLRFEIDTTNDRAFRWWQAAHLLTGTRYIHIQLVNRNRGEQNSRQRRDMPNYESDISAWRATAGSELLQSAYGAAL
jgi:heme/copper-type cytochrome/quinol oxidase subunit 3